MFDGVVVAVDETCPDAGLRVVNTNANENDSQYYYQISDESAGVRSADRNASDLRAEIARKPLGVRDSLLLRGDIRSTAAVQRPGKMGTMGKMGKSAILSDGCRKHRGNICPPPRVFLFDSRSAGTRSGRLAPVGAPP